MLHARCDESYAGGDPKKSPLYVVAGFVGTPEQWDYFDKLWRQDMTALKIDEIGLHTSKCAVGGKPYTDMSNDERYNIQYRMIVDIAAAQLYGCAAISDQEGYLKRRDLFSAELGLNKKFNEPHIITTRQCINLMLLSTEDATTEPLSFIVDQNTAFGGRAEEWYKRDVSNQHLDSPDMMGPLYRSRLGSFTQSTRKEVLGLQAADLLAYAVLRHALAERGLGKEAWQWKDLRSAVKIRDLTFGEEYWQEMELAVKDA
jgi:hypothetical protein